MMKFKFDKYLINFTQVFKNAGFSCFLVGGAIRNLYAGLTVSDYDFTTDAHPEDIMKLFSKVIPTGIKHGTVTVLYAGERIEVTTFRTDGKYTDARHPESVKYTANIYEDLSRRDFTINSMAYDISTKELIDPYNGKKDIKNKIIKAIGNPAERFQEDALRIMRACRFSSQLNFTIEKNTLNAMRNKAEKLKKISSERIKDELNKILLSNKPSIALGIMDKTSILEIILPELAECREIIQKGFHQFDVLYHSFFACDGAPKNKLKVRLAALFHDIGKPKSLSFDDKGIPTFYKHELYSAEITSKILKRLKYPKSVEIDVCHLIKNHMFNYQEEWKDGTVRRFMARVGIDMLEDLFLLRKADTFGMKNRSSVPDNLIIFQNKINDILEVDSAFCIKDLNINGNDLIEKAGIPRGVAIGTVLDFLLETVLEDPSQNKKENLLKLATNFYHQRIKKISN